MPLPGIRTGSAVAAPAFTQKLFLVIHLLMTVSFILAGRGAELEGPGRGPLWSPGGARPTLAQLAGAIEHGAVNRLPPKLMTVLAIMLGLLPALWSHGTGAEATCFLWRRGLADRVRHHP